MLSIKTVCFSITVAILSIITVPLFVKYARLEPQQPFALFTTHNASVNPLPYHARFRLADYKRSDRGFFQWWNYIVYDAKTNDHWSIIYQITDYIDKRGREDNALVAIIHFKGSTKKTQAIELVSFENLRVSNEFDLEYFVDGKSLFTQKVMDPKNGSIYQIIARFPSAIQLEEESLIAKSEEGANETAEKYDVEFELTFERLNGYYGSEDGEQFNMDNCLMQSNLYGYHSRVEGYIKERNVKYDIDKSTRYRAYVAGSWGCKLPRGDPAIKYPWSWFWVVVPSNNLTLDLGIVGGFSEFQSNSSIGDLSGGYIVASYMKKQISARQSRIFWGTKYETILQSSTNDGYVIALYVNRSNWAVYSDDFGTAEIPLRQTFVMITKGYEIVVDMLSSIDQYFRASIITEDENGIVRLFSDFRAVGVAAHVSVRLRGSEIRSDFEGDINTMTALEFAYQAPVNFIPELKIHNKKRS